MSEEKKAADRLERVMKKDLETQDLSDLARERAEKLEEQIKADQKVIEEKLEKFDGQLTGNKVVVNGQPWREIALPGGEGQAERIMYRDDSGRIVSAETLKSEG